MTINIIFLLTLLLVVAEFLLLMHGLSGCRVKMFLWIAILLVGLAIFLLYRHMRMNNIRLRPLMMSWGGLTGKIPYDDDPNDSTVTGLGWTL